MQQSECSPEDAQAVAVLELLSQDIDQGMGVGRAQHKGVRDREAGYV